MTYILISTEYPFEVWGEFDTYAAAEEAKGGMSEPWNWTIEETSWDEEDEEPFTLQEPEGDCWDEENDWREEGNFIADFLTTGTMTGKKSLTNFAERTEVYNLKPCGNSHRAFLL